MHVAGLTHATPGPWTAVREGVAASRLARVVALVLVCAAGGALRIANFAAVPTTPFYDAAVRSMGLSWHNFFYGALDPSAWLAIDKPPLDLWLQVASTKLFGFSSVALRLPPALAGILVIPLLYDLVRRGFGRGAGLAAAATYAVLPATVLTSRSDTMDTVMALLLVLAAWLIVRAAPARRSLVVAAGAAAGLAFEIKLTEAMVALPALVLLAWLALEEPAARKRRTLALAGGAFAVTASMWAVAASLLPGRHPFAYGSPDGSIWQMILVYNGISRLGNPPTSATHPGPFRLFDPSGPRFFGELIGSELLCALAIGALAAILAFVARRGAPVSRLRHAIGWGIGTWLILGFLVASFMGRQWPRYLEAFTPAVAATVGIGLAVFAEAAGRSRRALVAPAVVALVAVVAGRATGGSATANVVGTVLAAAAMCVLAAAFATRSGRRRGIAAAGCGVLLAAVLAVPLAASASLVRAGKGDGEPTGALPAPRLDRLSAYLRSHQGGARYEAAGARIFNTVALIVKDARPVQTLMSVGNRPLLTAGQLARESRAGLVRYVLIGQPACERTGGAASCPPVLRWAWAHSTDVSRAAGLPHRGILYRLPAPRGPSAASHPIATGSQGDAKPAATAR